MITTIADTDALLALFYAADSLHSRANSVFKSLSKVEHKIYLLPTTISEFALVGSYKMGREKVQKITSSFTESGYEIMAISNDMTTDALQLYEKQSSKEESLFNCYVMVAAKKFSVNCILSFDKGYRKKNFLLIEDWLKNG